MIALCLFFLSFLDHFNLFPVFKAGRKKQNKQQVREAESTFWTSLQTCTIIVGQTVLGLAHISSCRPLLVERKVVWLTTLSVCRIQKWVNYTEMHKIRMKWLPVLWFHSNCMQTWLQTSGSGFDWSTAGCVHCCLTLRWGLLIKNKKTGYTFKCNSGCPAAGGIISQITWWYLDKTITLLVAKCSNVKVKCVSHMFGLYLWNNLLRGVFCCHNVLVAFESTQHLIFFFWAKYSADGDALWITLPVRCWWNECGGDGEKIFANELSTCLDRVSAPSLSVLTFCLFGVADEI